MDLNELLDSNDPLIRNAAMVVNEAKVGYEAGELTREQFDELVEDALQVAEVDELADDLERKIAVQKAVDVLKMVIKLVLK